MSQVWDDQNRAIAVTILRVDPVRVVQLKTTARDGYAAVQVTYGTRKAQRLNKPEAGHYAAANVDPGKRLVELRVSSPSTSWPPGTRSTSPPSAGARASPAG
jgi:large subunit ribosomal protein L3